MLLRFTALLLLLLPIQAQISADLPLGAAAGSGSTFYGISGTNLFRSTDAGANWTATYPTATPGLAQQILAISADPTNPATVYIGTEISRGGVLKSTDSGATWTRANSGLPPTGSVQRLFTVENQPATFYAKIGATLYKTVNGASTWTLQSNLPADSDVFTINTRTPSLMYFSRLSGVAILIYRSSNEGATWDQVSALAAKPTGGTGGVDNGPGGIVSDPANPDVVYVSTRGPYANPPYNAIHKSTNRGFTWDVVRPGGQAHRLYIDSTGAVYWSGSEYASGLARFEKSTNGGQTWQAKVVDDALRNEPFLTLSHAQPNVILAATGGGLYRSTNSGDSFTKLGGLVKGTIAIPTDPVSFSGPPNTTLSQTLSIRFLEGASWAAPYTATIEGASWLTLSATSGNTPANLTARVDTTGLTKGSYSANIRVSSPGAVRDSVIPVALNITDAITAPRYYRISTVVGGGAQDPIGALATDANLQTIRGVALDPSGRLYFSQASSTQGHRIYRLNSSNRIELVAGASTSGSSGDGQPATLAQFNVPNWITFAKNGDLYISDTLNNRLRRIDSQGIIDSIGSTRSLLSATAIDNDDNLYIAQGSEIRRRTPDGQEAKFADGFLLASQLARDPQGRMYLARSTVQHRVYRINSGGAPTSIAGTDTSGYMGDGGLATLAQLNGPNGVAADPDGNIFIADTGNDRVRMIDPTGVIYTIAGNGQSAPSNQTELATEAGLSFPYSLALASNGDIYVADAERIRKLTLIRPSIKASGVADAASYFPDASPGSLVAIFGTDIATSTAQATSIPWPTSLANATVTLNGRAMPLYYASPTQVNAMVPYETAPGPATLIVKLGNVVSASYTLNINAASPGIIGFGDNRAVAVNEDGSVNTATNPARPGSAVVIYMLGLGPTDFPVGTGEAAPLDRLVRPTNSAIVQLGSQTVTPLFLGLTPGSVALAQLNLQLDANLPDGDYPVKVTIAGKASNAPVITIHR